eukprot:5422210-Pyramimonas_sp.AAC.1
MFLDLAGPTPKRRPRSDCRPPAPQALPAPDQQPATQQRNFGNIEHSEADQRAYKYAEWLARRQ